jgi:hypothetical protein
VYRTKTLLELFVVALTAVIQMAAPLLYVAMVVNAFYETMFLCFYGNVLVTSFTVILRPLDYGTATRENPDFREALDVLTGLKMCCV